MGLNQVDYFVHYPDTLEQGFEKCLDNFKFRVIELPILSKKNEENYFLK